MRSLLVLLTVAILCPDSSAQRRAPLPEGTEVIRDLAYIDGGHERQKLDLYLPHNVDRPPLVVWIHGGGWAKGSKDNLRAAAWILEEGYAVASIGYRLTDAAVFPAQLEDCKAALLWLRQHGQKHGIKTDKIVVWGSSAGGHLVSMLGTTGDPADPSDDIAGVINFYGPAELLTMQAQRRLPTQLNADAPDSFESRLVGAPIQQAPEKTREASPVTHVSADDAPFLILHGDRDALVPLKQSQILEERLNKAGVEVSLLTLEGAGHGGPEFVSDPARTQILEFLEAKLR